MLADIKNHWKLKALNVSAKKFIAKFNEGPVRIRIMSDAEYDASYNSAFHSYIRNPFHDQPDEVVLFVTRTDELVRLKHNPGTNNIFSP